MLESLVENAVVQREVQLDVVFLESVGNEFEGCKLDVLLILVLCYAHDGFALGHQQSHEFTFAVDFCLRDVSGGCVAGLAVCF